MKTKTSLTINPISQSFRHCGTVAGLLVALVLALTWLTLAPKAGAQCPQMCDANTSNTALGIGALVSITNGADNTAIGFDALFADTTGGFNTAVGFRALNLNTTGFQNTAMGLDALQQNTTGSENTALGEGAMDHNGTGSNNTAVGAAAAIVNSTGNDNTAVGFRALLFNSTSNDNTAVGSNALSNTTGSSNIALGSNAGANLTTGSHNIDIGAPGVAGESNTIRIGRVGVQRSAYIRGISGATVASGVTVIVDTNGHLGTVQSSARFKEAIKPMDKASEAILALQPVSFRYKPDLDPDGVPQFGLVAEDVEKVNPDLVVRDKNGEIYAVRYDAVNAMLLNEFLKEHRQVQEQRATIAQLKSTVEKQEATNARQQKQIEALTAGLQKVSARLEVGKSAPQTALKNH